MKNEGLRRIAIAVGCVSALAWTVFFLSQVFDPRTVSVPPQGLLIGVAGVPVTFGAGFLVIWVIDWIIDGFRGGKPGV